MDNGSSHQSYKKLYGTFQTGRRSPLRLLRQSSLCRNSDMGRRERALTQRTCLIFLTVFYRGRRAVPNGIGIGLALARSIFELQNGTITACNLQNGGACFEIRIYRPLRCHFTLLYCTQDHLVETPFGCTFMPYKAWRTAERRKWTWKY